MLLLLINWFSFLYIKNILCQFPEFVTGTEYIWKYQKGLGARDNTIKIFERVTDNSLKHFSRVFIAPILLAYVVSTSDMCISYDSS
jgi:hypothetical protein